MICTKNKLKLETDFIKKILLNNGYPEDIVLKHISKIIAQFLTAKPFGPGKGLVYNCIRFRAPWIGSPLSNYNINIKVLCKIATKQYHQA